MTGDQDSDRLHEVDANLGISRRGLIKRGAIVGGTIAWVAPTLQSFRSPAFAATSAACTAEVCLQVTSKGRTFVKTCIMDANSTACACCCIWGECAGCDHGGVDPCETELVFVVGSCTKLVPGTCP